MKKDGYRIYGEYTGHLFKIQCIANVIGRLGGLLNDYAQAIDYLCEDGDEATTVIKPILVQGTWYFRENGFSLAREVDDVFRRDSIRERLHNEWTSGCVERSVEALVKRSEEFKEDPDVKQAFALQGTSKCPFIAKSLDAITALFQWCDMLKSYTCDPTEENNEND